MTCDGYLDVVGHRIVLCLAREKNAEEHDRDHLAGLAEHLTP